MTTALIGKYGEQAIKARVALLTRRAGSGLAAVFARGGHELHECQDWAGLEAIAAAGPLDLVLCDEDAPTEPVRDLGCPTLVLGERHVADGAAISQTLLESGLDTILSLAVALARSNSRCRELERMTSGIRTGSAIVGRSPAIRRLQSAISRAADGDATVLIEGPAGSGKSLAARSIHCKSKRSNRPMLAIDAEATSVEGLVKALDETRGSTLVIENVDRLPATSQAQLVRHLKERNPNGATNSPRLIVTTAAHLPELVARGAFREDLFYRLHAMPMPVPGLKERVDDIAMLAQSILENSTAGQMKLPTLSSAAVTALETMSWPGNVAQLESVVCRAHLLAGGNTIEREHVVAPAPVVTAASHIPTAPKAAEEEQEIAESAILPFEQEEQRMLSRALRATRGNVRRAAQLLGIGRATLYRKIQQYNLRLQ